MEDQRVLHWFITDTFKFDKVNAAPAATSDDQGPAEENEVNEATVDNKATVDTIPENSTEETKDPAQVDLEDMIAEVESEAEPTIEEQRAEYWDQQTRVEEGLDHKGGDDDDDEPVDDSPEITGIPDGDKLSDTDDEDPVYDEDQIAERIKEDEAAVAEVCDEPEDIKIHVESDEEYQKRVAEIEGEITDAEAEELIKGQEAVDQQMAQDAAADNSVSDENVDIVMKGEPDFELDFASTDDEDDVQSGDVDFDFA